MTMRSWVNSKMSATTIGQMIHRAPRTVGTVLSLFLLCNVFLLQAVFEERSLNSSTNPGESGSAFFAILRQHFNGNVDNKQWRISTTVDNEIQRINNNEVILKTIDEEIKRDYYLSCESLSKLKGVHFIASGWTKSTYKATYNITPVAVKTVNVNGHDVTECLKEYGRFGGLSECYMQASAKILKEIFLLSQLVKSDVGLIKMLGYCVPQKKFSADDQNSVSIITELGEPFDVIKLLQMSWEDRLRITLDLSRFLHYFSNSPLGVLRVNDFRRQQFVLVKGQLKLSDLDDVTSGDPICDRAQECTVTLPGKNQSESSTGVNMSVPCVAGVCRGLSEKLNIVQAGRHFVKFILPNGAPLGLTREATEVTEAFRTGDWNATYLLNRVERLVKLYATGQYRRNSTEQDQLIKPSLQAFSRLDNSDQPGLHDYHCRLSLSGQQGCTLSVVDAEEAAQLCTSDIQCGAFVITDVTTWTGRRLAHFKNGPSTPVFKPGATLYVKKLN